MQIQNLNTYVGDLPLLVASRNGRTQSCRGDFSAARSLDVGTIRPGIVRCICVNCLHESRLISRGGVSADYSISEGAV